MNDSCLIVIPARLASTRLPEKLLLRAGGKPVLQHTYEAAKKSTTANRVVVAVDDQRLAEQVDSFGGEWMMTSVDCASGTDRIAEVAAAIPDFEYFINVQGDEPEIKAETIDAVGEALIKNNQVDIATAATAITTPDSLADPSVVKVVLANFTAGQGRAVYFSRSPVPYVRDTSESNANQIPNVHWHHVGLYAYRRDFLTWFANQPAGLLEQVEKLEQLRALEAGKRIDVVQIPNAAPGIDTQADFDAFKTRVEA